jgi:NAD(P)H-hydrate epimerase
MHSISIISKLQDTNMTVNLYTAEQVKELDRIAIEGHGIDGFQLMQKAARFAFHTLVKQWPSCKWIHVFCGSGNNAGDGYILAAIAKQRGFDVTLHYLSPPENLKQDALLAYNFSQEANVGCKPFTNDSASILSTDNPFVIIDAMLGTGLNSEVTGLYKQAILLCNQSTAPILAIDIPSGLSANTGQPFGVAIKAECTATFIGVKQGMLTGDGRNYCGEVFYDDLGITADIYDQVPVNAKKLNINTVLKFIKPRTLSAHKGLYGHVLLIGGDNGYGGAILIAAEAAARMGAGLVSVATQPEHVSALLSRQPEVMAKAITNYGDLLPLLEQANVIVIGPGLGQSAWSEQMLYFALKSTKTIVLDADALNILCKKPKWLIHSDLILTPHPGEASRLLDLPTVSVQEDRFKSVKAIQKKWGGSVLLKGSGSLISHEEGLIKLCPYGNPGMASGGMGDVLSGMLGGLIAQGLSKEDALELAVCLHATAADIAAQKSGVRGLLATDLIAVARLLLNGKLS